MKTPLQPPKAQQGAALLLFAAVLTIGIAWYVLDALNEISITRAEREVRTGLALQAAKRALLSHVAHYAARPDHDFPGRMPCPESTNLTNPGEASASCSNTSAPLGRLPWKTLGIEELRDGDGEPLWYALSPNFHPVSFPLNPSPPNPWLNFATPAALPFDGAMVVAVIIAPGRPLNTLGDAATPPAGCSKVDQHDAGRNVAPLDRTEFLECGNASGSYANLGSSPWTNDRAISISAAEWQDAITAGVADRLQRQVTPAIADWNQVELVATGKTWPSTYLPFASSFTDPASNDYCGEPGVREGLPPLAPRTSAGCDTKWTATVSLVSGLVFLGCTQSASDVRCDFLNLLATPPFSARIVATAPNVAGSFRGPVTAADVVYSPGAPSPDAPTSTSFSLALSETTGEATATIDVSWPLSLGLGLTVSVTIPHLPDAAVLADPRLTWFRNNRWERFTYYAAAPSATLNATSVCVLAGDPGCVEVRGLPVSTGDYWSKRLVFVLAGAPLAYQSRSCATDVNANSIPDCQELSQYLEEHNASANDRVFRADLRIANPVAAPPFPAFNDRVAACPFHWTLQSGPPIALCS